MKHVGRLIAFFIMIMITSFVLWNPNHVDLILLLICPIGWWIGNEYDRVREKVEILKKEKVENERNLNQRIIDREDIIESTYGGVFCLNQLEEKIYFSHEVEKILGYPIEMLGSNVDLWRNIIHPDDLDKVKQDEALLLQGKKIEGEYRIIHPSSGVKWISKKAIPHHNSTGQLIKITGQLIDITDRKHSIKQLEKMAYYDELTELPNRYYLDRYIQDSLNRAKLRNYPFTIMFIDLDDFKIVNDTMGHEAGDLLLKEVSIRLREYTKDEGVISRIGGDEFIIILENKNTEQIMDIAQRLIETVSTPYTILSQEATISLSIGMSSFPNDGDDKERLIERADKAMYFAKKNGKNHFQLYTAELADMEVKSEGLLQKWFSRLQISKFLDLN